jgi:peptidoglycan/LPS O-acetylase OafA/YrhL
MAFLRWPFWVGLLVLLLGLSLGAWRLKNPVLPGAHILADLLLDPIFGHVSRYEAHQIGGILVVSAVVFTSRLQAPLSNGVSKFLGAVSFPLYLSHVLVLASFGCLLLAWSDTAFGVSVARVIAISATFIVSVLVAALLRRLVEEPSIAFARQIGGGCDRWLRKRIKFA